MPDKEKLVYANQGSLNLTKQAEIMNGMEEVDNILNIQSKISHKQNRNRFNRGNGNGNDGGNGKGNGRKCGNKDNSQQETASL